MLKLNTESGSYPWIVMGIGAVMFSIGAWVVMIIIRNSQMTMIFGIAPLFNLLPTIVILVLMDILLFKGKKWFKMILVSIFIISVQLAFTFVLYPIIAETWLSILLFKFINAYFVLINSLIAGVIYAAFIYGRKEMIRFSMICGLVSLPFCVINEILYAQAVELTKAGAYATADLLWGLISPLGFLSMGVGLSICIGLKVYQDSKIKNAI